MKNSQKGFAIITIVIVLIIIGAAGYFVWQKKFAKESPSTSLGTTGDYSSWKTYRNEQYGFEIKLPDAWKDKNVKESHYPDGDAISFVFKDNDGSDYTVAILEIVNETGWQELNPAAKSNLIIQHGDYYFIYSHPQAAPLSNGLLERVNEGKSVLSGIKFDK